MTGKRDEPICDSVRRSIYETDEVKSRTNFTTAPHALALCMVQERRRGKVYEALHTKKLTLPHRCSMSRKGNCWDNAVIERFFLNLKMERVWQRDYANHGEAQRDIADYIVSFYNCTRLHSKLGYLSPAAYERQMTEILPVEVSENT